MIHSNNDDSDLLAFLALRTEMGTRQEACFVLG